MSMLRRRVEAKRMGTQRPVAGAQKTVASRRVVAGLGIVLDQTGSEQFMDEIDRRVSFKARFAKETRERQEKLAEMRGEVATAQRKAIAAKVKSSRSSLKTQMQSDKRVPRSAMGYFDHLGGKTESDALSQLEKYIPDLVKEYRAAKTSDSEVGQSATADKGNGTKLPIPSESHRAGVRARHQTTALWHDRVQNVYADIEELRAYDEMYGLLDRINKTGGKYESIESLWEANPEIKGSTNPKDFGMYRAKAKAAADLSVAVPEGVSPEAVEEGARVEKEHGTTYNQIKEYYAENGEFPPFDTVTEWIASDHLREFADYYEALEAMEEELKAGEGTGAEAMRAKASGNTEKAINKAVNEYWEPKLGERGKRLINWLNADLYHGPYAAGTTDEEDNPDATYPGFTAAIDEVREIIDNAGGFQDMYYDNDSGALMEDEPGAFEDEETGEMIEPYLEETYHLESSDVARYVLGKELVSYVI